ncbi:MAG: trimethylamine methyltransferase family protein [Deltaproteobacteria bacterium]|uniref:Trimethylamine methyltransferase family protein n=1 Tax=Candidatus Zymogenus saltonus TaxID=2844893 RepID=A0A9D8KCM2_9DELT|nr:trimethylamine methyltransferase family protein [Candidatus Zymogenus saltonus]
MKSTKFQVLSEDEVKRIHGLSFELMEEVGIKVEVKKMRQMLADAGCKVDEATKIVKFPQGVVEDYLKKVPREFVVCGADPDNEWVVNPDTQIFGGLGTAIGMYDLKTGEYRPTTLKDTIDHVILFDYLDNIVSNQMDYWPHDIPMQTIHSETIRGWAENCTKSFGMGAYGVMPTTDMMEMTAIVMGGKEAIKKKHPFISIVSIQSPLSTSQIQVEGMMILAEHGQPVIPSPEAMAGTTAPASLAGLLTQHNAEILSHIVMTQVVNPGNPVLYGSVSTIAEMRRGTVYLGAVETGMISAASAQLAHHLDIPCRVVAGATESKTLDIQCGVERVRSIMLAAMSGANYITCVGTIESTTGGSHEISVVDDELIGTVKRALRGIDVDDNTLAMDVIRSVGPDGNYISERHTQQNFRKEHFIPKLASIEKRDIWEKEGKVNMIDMAREKALNILEKHKPRDIDPKLKKELDDYCEMVKNRSLDEFYAAEWEV